MDDDIASMLAKSIATMCVRNTYLEDLHAGTGPSSKTGDYTDVKVVTPYGEIPWNELSRISQDEMKIFMKEVVNKLYTFFSHQNDPAFAETFLRWGTLYASKWDEPELDQDLLGASKITLPVGSKRKKGKK